MGSPGPGMPRCSPQSHSHPLRVPYSSLFVPHLLPKEGESQAPTLAQSVAHLTHPGLEKSLSCSPLPKALFLFFRDTWHKELRFSRSTGCADLFKQLLQADPTKPAFLQPNEHEKPAFLFRRQEVKISGKNEIIVSIYNLDAPTRWRITIGGESVLSPGP